MHRFPFQSWLNYNPLLPARGKLSTPVNSPHHTGQENVWFVGCSTTARAMAASGESVKTQGKKPKLKEKTQALGDLILALAPN